MPKPKPKPPATAVAKPAKTGRGRPTLYKPDFATLAQGVARMGGTSDDIGEACGVSRHAIHLWLAQKPEFAAAVRAGREAAYDKLESSLYNRALGFRYKTQKAVGGKNGAEVVEVEEFCPGDARAAQWILANRRKDRWALIPENRVKLNITTDGSARSLTDLLVSTLNALAAGEMSSEEAARVAKLVEITTQSLDRLEVERRLEALEDPKLIGSGNGTD
jgi:hypothetical protein